MAFAAVLIVAASAAVALSAGGSAKDKTSPHLTRLQREVLASRTQAATWIAQQVSQSTPVACDPAMCTALENSGFPISDLAVLGQSSQPPLSSALVVETANVRTWLGTGFSSNSAPTILASFGNNAARIEIRVIAQGGVATYERELTTDLANRKSLGAELLNLRGNRDIAISSSARTQMETGEVDIRVLYAIADLAGVNPISVIDFGNNGSGSSPGVPLRYVDLAQNYSAAHLSAEAYLAWLLKAVNELQYPVKHTESVKLRDGTTALRIEFDAPTPLGLKPN